jgi:tRNA threonylcarbamoyladenosine biosynthesis protein TsaE
MRLDLIDENATQRLGEILAKSARIGDFFALHGDLGAGKTTFARGFISALTDAAEVPSPTFTILQAYDSDLGEIWHFDLYRIESPDDIWELGWEEISEKITLAEWVERAGQYLPQQRLEIYIEFVAKEMSGLPERAAVLKIVGDKEYTEYWQHRFRDLCNEFI